MPILSAAADKHEVTSRTPEEIEAARKAAEVAAAAAARTAALAAEKTRTDGIRAMFRQFTAHRDLMDACIADQETALEATASTKLLQALGNGAEPLRPAGEGGGRIEPGASDQEKRLAGASSALVQLAWAPS